MKTENQELKEKYSDEQIDKEFKKVIRKIPLAFSLFFVAAIIKGVALKALWFWFITTPFNLPPINLALSIGLIILINYSFTQRGKTKKEVSEIHNQLSVNYVLKEIKDTILKFLMVIAIGYSLHFFI